MNECYAKSQKQKELRREKSIKTTVLHVHKQEEISTFRSTGFDRKQQVIFFCLEIRAAEGRRTMTTVESGMGGQLEITRIPLIYDGSSRNGIETTVAYVVQTVVTIGLTRTLHGRVLHKNTHSSLRFAPKQNLKHYFFSPLFILTNRSPLNN